MPTPLPADADILASLGVGQPGVPPLPSGPVPSAVATQSGGGGGLDLSSLISGQNTSLANAQAQMASDFSQVNTASNAIVGATQREGADNAAVLTQQATGLLQAQTAVRQVAASYGGNPDDVSFIMNKLGAQWEDTEAQRLAAEKVVQQKQSVSFVDDPLQWLSNKLTVNTDINNYNNLEEQSNELYDQLSKINTLNSTTAESMKAIAQTQTAATVQATADAAAQKTAIASAQAQIQGVLYNAKGLQDLSQMGQQQVDNLVKGQQTAIAAGHLAVAQQQLGIMQKEYDAKAELYQQEVKDKQQQDSSDAALLDSMNRGFATMGLPPVDRIKGFNLIKAGGQPGEIAKQALSIGLLQGETGKPIIAPTSGTAARILATVNSPIATVNPAVKPVTDLLSDSYSVARNPTNAQALGINPKDVTTLDSAITGVVNQKLTAMASDIKPGDTSNIFQAPPLTALASLPSVKENPVYTKILEPQVKAGMAETDPTKLISITADAIQQGQISLGDAANGLSSLFNSAAALNTASKDFTRFGIAPQSQYVTNINMTGIFGGSTKVNMMDKAQVTTAIMKYLANSSRIQSLQMGGQ